MKMKNISRKAIAGVTMLAMLLCGLPIAALADDAETSSSTVLANADAPLGISAYYEATSSHAGNQVVHPDVAVIPEDKIEQFSGHQYWMSYTPNVSGYSGYENPSVAYSDDMTTWTALESNPLYPEPTSTAYHNCDTDLLYDPNYEWDDGTTGALILYWNWANDGSNTSVTDNMAVIFALISKDGVNWEGDADYASHMDDYAGLSDSYDGSYPYVVIASTTERYSMLSPTFLYNEDTGTYMMWATDAGNVGYNNGQNNVVRVYYSENPLSGWSEGEAVSNFLSTTTEGEQLAPWHQDVMYITSRGEYWCLSQCFTGSSPDGSMLYLTKSEDGVNWSQVGTEPVLSPGEEGSWDDFQIYRSTMYYDEASDTLHVWYSSLHTVTDTSNDSYYGAVGSADSKIWKIGYTSGSFTEILDALETETVSAANLASGKACAFYNTADDSAASPDSDSARTNQATDGIISASNYSGWNSSVPDSDSSSYMQIDLGDEYNISGVDLWRYYADGRTYEGTVIAISSSEDFENYEILYNSDQENFHGLGAGTDETYVETSDGLSIDADVSGRYLRVYMHGSDVNTSNQITEIKVWESTEQSDTETPETPDDTSFAGTFTVSQGSTIVRLNKGFIITMTSDTNVDHFTVNGVEVYPNNLSFVNRGLTDTYQYSYSLKATALGTLTAEVIAYDVNGYAGDPVVLTATVTKTGK